MVKINTKKYLVLDNGSGGRVALEFQKEFSSAIPYRQIRTNGELDFSKNRNNVLKKKELEKYHHQKFDKKEEAIRAVEEGIVDQLEGTSDILSEDSY